MTIFVYQNKVLLNIEAEIVLWVSIHSLIYDIVDNIPLNVIFSDMNVIKLGILFETK